MEKLRQFVVDKFSENLNLPKDSNLCINLEKCIYNWSIEKTYEYNETPTPKNKNLLSRYKHKYLEIINNFKRSDIIKNKLLKGDIKTINIINMTPGGLYPNGPYARALHNSIERAMQKEYNAVNDPDYKGIFRCNKCKKFKTSYYELQTRSADEPMTVFVTCHVCNVTWKS